MSAQAAVKITRRRDIADVPEHNRDEAIAVFAAEHSELTGGLQRAVDNGIVDEVIDPAGTRTSLATLVAGASTIPSRQKNIPL
jgi:acetyl-CoA/propionyl-CoA carboxylase carboxyl transferase subunit